MDDLPLHLGENRTFAGQGQFGVSYAGVGLAKADRHRHFETDLPFVGSAIGDLSRIRRIGDMRIIQGVAEPASPVSADRIEPWQQEVAASDQFQVAPLYAQPLLDELGPPSQRIACDLVPIQHDAGRHGVGHWP